MIKSKKLIALGLSSLTAMCFVGMSNVGCKIDVNAASVGNTQNGDVNGDGDVSLADAVCVSQYLSGAYNITYSEVADFNNDGFISQTDVQSIQDYIMDMKKPSNPDYIATNRTLLNDSTVDYNLYNSNGEFIDDYRIYPTYYSAQNYSIIGDDDRIPDNSHSAICLIATNDGGIGTGFVASNNSILTAGHCLKDKNGIKSITFFDKNGKKISFNPEPINYSIPQYYEDNENPNFDYALITVKKDLSAYNDLNIGYALQYAIDQQATVYVTGYQNAEMETGIGRLTSTSDNYRLYYTCDTVPGVSGSPIYADIIYNKKHYYTVVGIHTNGDSRDPAKENKGVRMCPNITNLIKVNSK